MEVEGYHAQGGEAAVVTSKLRLHGTMGHAAQGSSEFAPHNLVSLLARSPAAPLCVLPIISPLALPRPTSRPPTFCHAAQAACN